MSETEPTGQAPHIARLPSNSGAHNLVVMHNVELWFQKSPGVPGSEHREIRDLRYQLRREGNIVRSARVARDGKISFRAPLGETLVELLVDNRVVASYRVIVEEHALEAVNTVTGQQRRLRMLGYHLGHSGPSGDGVDGSMGSRTEQAILNYQTDKGIAIVGNVDSATRNALTNDVVT